MELKDFLIENRVRIEDFSRMTRIYMERVSNISSKRVSPTLPQAIRIHDATLGRVSFRELLADPVKEREHKAKKRAAKARLLERRKKDVDEN